MLQFGGWLQPGWTGRWPAAGPWGEGKASGWTNSGAIRKELGTDMKEGFAQVRADMKELRSEPKADNRALGEKLDRLIEALLTAKQP